MTADDVKTALRRRHPAVDGTTVGQWTCLEEFRNIDLLAVSAWASSSYRRVGYEVKVSRGDLRAELLKPRKRAGNVAWCNEFYLAVPAGLLTPDELSWREPEWAPGDFARTPCEAGCRKGRHGARGYGQYERRELPEDDERRAWLSYETPWVTCATCGGKGYAELSRVEREAPQLWIPRDVGLVLVYDGQARVERPSPKRMPKRGTDDWRQQAQLAEMARWASVRPDPRHVEAFLRLERAHEAHAAAVSPLWAGAPTE